MTSGKRFDIVTVQFNHEGCHDFTTLLDVFRSSVLRLMRAAEYDEYRIAAPDPDEGKSRHFKDNSVKLRIWNDHMKKTKRPVIFCDCDMVCLRPAFHAFKVPFDVGVTFRNHVGDPIMNGGIVMARPTQAARDFFQRWLDVNDEMYADESLRAEYKDRWCGMNQAAFGKLYSEPPVAKVHEFATREWNAVDSDWGNIDSETVFLHVKGKLRKLVLAGREPFGKFGPAMKAWYAERGYLEMNRCK